MTYDRSIDQAAYYYLARNGVDSLPVTLSAIERMIRSEGYKVVMYALKEELPQELRRYASFAAVTCTDGDGGTVYGNINFPLGERLFAMAHELGHIVLRHVGVHACGAVRAYIEEEADTFAYAILAPLPVLWYYGARTAEGVQGCTLLSTEHANRVIERTSGREPTREEMSILSQFWRPITPTRLV